LDQPLLHLIGFVLFACWYQSSCFWISLIKHSTAVIFLLLEMNEIVKARAEKHEARIHSLIELRGGLRYWP
jgi:hypothetical protein